MDSNSDSNAPAEVVSRCWLSYQNQRLIPQRPPRDQQASAQPCMNLAVAAPSSGYGKDHEVTLPH